MKQWIIQYFHELKSIQSSPHSIALGFTIGSFISILPTPGFNFLLGFVVILLFPKVSKIALFAGIIFWNPIISIPIYIGSYSIGNLLFSSAPIIEYKWAFLNHTVNFSRRYLIGNLIIAASLLPLCYFLPYYIAKKYQKKKL